MLVRTIIESMYNTIRITLVLICLFSFSGLLYKAFSDLCALVFRKVSLAHELAQQQAQFAKQIQALSQQERVVFDYVKDGGGVWVSEFDATVLMLLHKGLLERIEDVKCFSDWPPNTDERASCILVAIPKEISENYE